MSGCHCRICWKPDTGSVVGAPAPPAEVSMVGLTHLQFCAVSVCWLPGLTQTPPVLTVWLFVLKYFQSDINSPLSVVSFERISRVERVASGVQTLRSEEWGLTLTSYMASQSVSPQSSSGFHTVQTSGQPAAVTTVTNTVFVFSIVGGENTQTAGWVTVIATLCNSGGSLYLHM